MKCRLIKMILVAVMFNNICLASEDVTQVSRYLTIENKVKPEQINPINQVIQVHFPQDVQTIGSAINYLLRFSGYSLVIDEKRNAGLRITLDKPLPIVNRELGPVSLKNGLATLAGDGFILVCDPINREIDFKLKPSYRKYLNRGQT